MSLNLLLLLLLLPVSNITQLTTNRLILAIVTTILPSKRLVHLNLNFIQAYPPISRPIPRPSQPFALTPQPFGTLSLLDATPHSFPNLYASIGIAPTSALILISRISTSTLFSASFK